MRKTLMLLVCCLLLSVAVIAQDKIIGKWKITIVDIPKYMYLDMEKDSVYAYPEALAKIEEKGDSLAQQLFVGFIKSNLMNSFNLVTISVKENGDIFFGTAKNLEADKVGFYDAGKSIFILKEKDGKPAKEIPVEFKDGLLKFVYGGADNNTVMWCKPSKE